MATWSKVTATMTTNVGGYWIFTPTGASSSSACIIALHGLGEQGSGSQTDLDLLTTEGFSELIDVTMGTGNEFPYDCICIFPQYTGGAPTLFRVQGIIDYVKANFTFDQNKLHLTGLSLGAQGVTNWLDIGDLSDIASMSVLSTPSTYYANGSANAVAYDMPMFFLHGDADENPFTPFSKSVDWVNGLNNDGISPAAKLHLIPGGGHNIYNEVYKWYEFTVDGQTLMQWHLQYSRSSATLTHELLYYSGGVMYKFLLYSDLTWKQQQYITGEWTDVTKQTYNIRWKVGSTLYRAALTPTTYSMI